MLVFYLCFFTIILLARLLICNVAKITKKKKKKKKKRKTFGYGG